MKKSWGIPKTNLFSYLAQEIMPVFVIQTTAISAKLLSTSFGNPFYVGMHSTPSIYL